jgi:AAA15 family ATPase/GTPase
MELVYLWVEEYKNIHKQGFNFSPRFHCEFNDEYDDEGNLKDNCKLIICDREDTDCEDKEECRVFCGESYIKDFFGENINVTAIVGKNGSGKSSVLNAVVNCEEESFPSDRNYILAYSDGKNEYYNSNFELNTDLTQQNDANLIIYLDRKDNDSIPIDTGATTLSVQSKSPWVNFKEIDISKEAIIRLLAVEIGKADPTFKLSTFMYIPKKNNY